MANPYFIHRLRLFLDHNMNRILIYLATLVVIAGIACVISFNLKTQPLYGFIGVLLILAGPFFVGLICGIIHKIVILIDHN